MSNSFPDSFFQIFSIIKGEYITQFLVLVLFLFVQFYCCSVAQSYPSCPSLCNPMDCSMPGFPVLHYLPEFAQTHVHWVDDTIQPSHPLSPLSPPTHNISQHQGIFQWVSSSGQVTKVLELQLQHCLGCSGFKKRGGGYPNSSLVSNQLLSLLNTCGISSLRLIFCDAAGDSSPHRLYPGLPFVTLPM